MKVWLDAMLPPWLCGVFENLGADAEHVGLKYPEDAEIFEAAGAANAVLVTKDRDFVSLVERRGTPPQVIWLTCGNCSNRELERILRATFRDARELLERGEALVEISGAGKAER